MCLALISILIYSMVFPYTCILKYLSPRKIFAGMRDFRRDPRFSPKFEIFAEIRNFRQNPKFSPKFWRQRRAGRTLCVPVQKFVPAATAPPETRRHRGEVTGMIPKLGSRGLFFFAPLFAFCVSCTKQHHIIETPLPKKWWRRPNPRQD